MESPFNYFILNLLSFIDSIRLKGLWDVCRKPIARAPMMNGLGPTSNEPYMIADNLKEFFDNGLGLVTLSFIDREDIPVFAREVSSELR